MSPIRILVSAFLMAACGQLSAGESAADLAIAASVQPDGILSPGTEVIATITITNNGPDIGIASFALRRTPDGTGSSFPPLVPQGLITGPCRIDPRADPLPPGFPFFPPWIIQDIGAGESRVCSFGFEVSDTMQIAQIARWEVSGANDPNAANNVADVLLLFAEPPDPVSVPAFSAWAAIILVLMLGALALRSSARHWP